MKFEMTPATGLPEFVPSVRSALRIRHSVFCLVSILNPLSSIFAARSASLCQPNPATPAPIIKMPHPCMDIVQI